MTTVTYPGAVAPERRSRVDVGGLELTVYEWGRIDDPVLFVVHGGFDFARTYDGFAPRLARGGWRVVSWDQRGHGDSDHAALYSWEADIRDAAAVMDAITDRPAAVLGHSKGGALMLQLADAQPFRFRALVNLDGMPYRRPGPDVADHERTRMLASDLSGWLDHRRRTVDSERRPGTMDELARRRGRMNPRLEHDWLRYLVSVGAREDADGWRWKIDPSMRMGGFGPWRPEWSITRLPGLQIPFLGVLVGQEEEMGWGTRPEHLERYLPENGRCELMADAGHFLHIEQPDRVASMVLEFLEGVS